jgi:hypothetical protein
MQNRSTNGKKEMYVYKNMISSVIHLKLFSVYNLQLFIFKNKKIVWALAGRKYRWGAASWTAMS